MAGWGLYSEGRVNRACLMETCGTWKREIGGNMDFVVWATGRAIVLPRWGVGTGCRRPRAESLCSIWATYPGAWSGCLHKQLGWWWNEISGGQLETEEEAASLVDTQRLLQSTRIQRDWEDSSAKTETKGILCTSSKWRKPIKQAPRTSGLRRRGEPRCAMGGCRVGTGHGLMSGRRGAGKARSG